MDLTGTAARARQILQQTLDAATLGTDAGAGLGWLFERVGVARNPMILEPIFSPWSPGLSPSANRA